MVAVAETIPLKQGFGWVEQFDLENERKRCYLKIYNRYYPVHKIGFYILYT